MGRTRPASSKGRVRQNTHLASCLFFRVKGGSGLRWGVNWRKWSRYSRTRWRAVMTRSAPSPAGLSVTRWRRRPRFLGSIRTT